MGILWLACRSHQLWGEDRGWLKSLEYIGIGVEVREGGWHSSPHQSHDCRRDRRKTSKTRGNVGQRAKDGAIICLPDKGKQHYSPIPVYVTPTGIVGDEGVPRLRPHLSVLVAMFGSNIECAGSWDNSQHSEIFWVVVALISYPRHSHWIHLADTSFTEIQLC